MTLVLRPLWALLMTAFVGLPVLAVTPDQALTTFKTGDYKTAIPQLQSVAAQPEKAESINSALLSALVYEGRVDEATALANQLAVDFPNSPDSLTARGEFFFYMADFGQAEKLYRSALKLKANAARAQYGLYRLYRAASHNKTARMLCLSAHAADPDDSLITLAFLEYLVGSKRNEMIVPFFATHPWFASSAHYEISRENNYTLREALAEHHAFEPVETLREVDVPLSLLYSGATQARGVGIVVSLGDGHPLRLLLDSGSSGILLSARAIEHAGLKRLGSSEGWGIGDKGIQKGTLAVADFCSIGPLRYKSCVFNAPEGKGLIAGQEDGLLGVDFFSKYLVHLDFQKRGMHLSLLPERASTPQGYDREIPPAEKDWLPVMRQGNHLFVPTVVNRKAVGLFLLDTGSTASLMDSTFARLSTRIHSDEYTHVRGVSGSVKEVFEASKAELQFGRFRQDNLGLTALNLNRPDHHQEFRMSGIIGMPILSMFRLDIDYRNGLVNLDYVLK